MKRHILTITLVLLTLCTCQKEIIDTTISATIAPSFNHNNTRGTITFDASGSIDDNFENSLLLYRWDFQGDGIWDIKYLENNKASHNYSIPGEYKSIVEVRNPDGDTDTASCLVMIDSIQSFVDIRDDKKYDFIRIADDYWMTSNICFASPKGYLQPYFHPDQNYLYEYNVAKTVCPDGWHISTDFEWKKLELLLGMAENEIDNYGNRYSGNIDDKVLASRADVFGLSVRPFGYVTNYVDILGVETSAWFWTPADQYTFLGTSRLISEGGGGSRRILSSKTNAARSVRCVKNRTEIPRVEPIAEFRIKITTDNALTKISCDAMDSWFISTELEKNNLLFRWDLGNDQAWETNYLIFSSWETYVPDGIYTIVLEVIDKNNMVDQSVKTLKIDNGQLFDIFIDSRDSEEYKVLKLGEDIWMAENLRHSIGTGSVPVHCDYTSDKDYGFLYSWDNAMLVCPEGWHLPSDQDWKKLEIYLGMDIEEVDQFESRYSGSVGEKLKAKEYWDFGTNLSGMGLMPSGYYYREEYYSCNKESDYWSSTEFEDSFTDKAIVRRFSQKNDASHRGSRTKRTCCSVRCVKD
jgi:uncharacterized protein (TIGR02145 family)